MSTVHFFGEINARGEILKLQGVVDRDDVEEAFKLSLDKDEDNFNVFAFEMDEKYKKQDAWLLFSAIWDDFEGELENAYDCFTNNKSFGLISEETMMGVAYNEKDAKIAYAEAQFDDEEDSF